MIDKRVYKLFVRFLKENDIYEKYIKNVNDYEISLYNHNEKSLLEYVKYNCDLINVYDWSETIEGYEYWRNVEKKWMEFISYAF